MGWNETAEVLTKVPISLECGGEWDGLCVSVCVILLPSAFSLSSLEDLELLGLGLDGLDAALHVAVPAAPSGRGGTHSHCEREGEVVGEIAINMGGKVRRDAGRNPRRPCVAMSDMRA